MVDVAPTSDEVMEEINALGIGTPEYHEAMWYLFSVLARKHAQMAHSARLSAQRRTRAAATRERNRRAVASSDGPRED